MDTPPPPPPPYGVLIEKARKAAGGLSIQRAADRAGIAKATWIDNARGYRRRGDHWERVDPKPETIARMAQAAGVTPDRLTGEGQRPDASEILTEMSRPGTAPAQPAFPEPPTAAEEALEKFPDDLVSQAIWRLPNTSAAEKWEMIATLRGKRAEIAERRPSQAS